jgi:putative ABC transport system permease protein
MLFTIAWRNIWRSRMRSMVVMLAIVIGIWSLAFMISFSLGMVRGYVDSAIENNLSHLQVHNPQFSADAEAQYFLGRTDERLAVIRQDKRVRAAAARTLVNGMLTTARTPRGVQIRGIDPAEEAALTRLDQKITDGSYFESQARHQLL